MGKKGKDTKTDRAAWFFLLPAGVIYMSVIVLPVFYSIFVSLHEWNGIAEKKFVGLQNYVKLLFDDEIFHTAVTNNLIWVLLTVAVTMTVALALAVMLNEKFKGRVFFRALFYFPCVIAPIAVAIIWRWIYNPTVGFINEFFRAIGVSFSQTWLSEPGASLYAVFLASLWQAIGQPMILFLAGLQAIPPDVLEVARVDGANGVQRFFFITLPLLKENFVVVIATLIIAAMKGFDIIQGLTGGGPGNSTQMLSTYMYSQVFRYNNVGYGTAVACIMVFLMALVIVPYINATAKEE